MTRCWCGLYSWAGDPWQMWSDGIMHRADECFPADDLSAFGDIREAS